MNPKTLAKIESLSRPEDNWFPSPPYEIIPVSTAYGMYRQTTLYKLLFVCWWGTDEQPLNARFIPASLADRCRGLSKALSI